MKKHILATGPETGNEKIIRNSRTTQGQYPDQLDPLHNESCTKVPENVTFTQNDFLTDHVSFTENPYRVLHPVSFVSLGPGDPELITLKALNILRQADIIYCPATASPSSVSEAAANVQEDLQEKGKGKKKEEIEDNGLEKEKGNEELERKKDKDNSLEEVQEGKKKEEKEYGNKEIKNGEKDFLRDKEPKKGFSCPTADQTFSGLPGKASRAARILEELGINPSRISAFPLPMSKVRNAALQAYDRVYEQATQNYRDAKRIVIVAEGDAGFYSSVQYIYDKFIENGIPVQRTAGVPAFIAAGALAGIHIVKQEEPLLVVPGIVDCTTLLQSLERGVHTVIMKLSQSEAAVKECICRAPGHGWHYFENVGTDGEFYTNSLETILARRFPYFSLMIILPEKRNAF